MKINVTNSCNKRRGCDVGIILPHDIGIRTIFSGVHGTKHDFPKILSLANLSLDKKLAQEGQMEKVAA